MIYPQLAAKVSAQRLSLLRLQSMGSILSTETIDVSPLTFSRFLILVSKIRKFFTQLTVILIVIYMPIYALISAYLKMYENSYIWKVSALLLSGIISGIVIMLLVIIFIIVLWFLMDFLHFRKDSPKESIFESDSKKENRFSTGEAVICVLNCIAIIMIDVVYVTIYLSGNTVAIVFAQICLAAFKIAWNDSLLWMFMNFVHNYSTRNDVTAKDLSLESSPTSKLPVNQERIPTVHEIFFMVMCNFFNNILLPCLAIMIVDPNCFYNAFVPARPITTSYVDCISYEGRLRHYACSEWQIVDNNSYDPPFVYSYQCSSSVIINYIPVHITQCILLSIILPAGRYIVKYIYDYLHHKKLYTLMNDANATQSDDSISLTVITTQNQWSDWQEKYLSLCKLLLPPSLQLFPIFYFDTQTSQLDESNNNNKKGSKGIDGSMYHLSSKKLMVSTPPNRLFFEKHKALIRIHNSACW
jgi:hypothetical protein